MKSDCGEGRERRRGKGSQEVKKRDEWIWAPALTVTEDFSVECFLVGSHVAHHPE